jgi:hypothetical protein
MSSSRMTLTRCAITPLLGWLTSSYGKAIMRPAKTCQSSCVPGPLWPDDGGRRPGRRSTSEAHHSATCQETLRTAEIAAAGQTACRRHPPRSGMFWHKTRSTADWRAAASRECRDGNRSPAVRVCPLVANTARSSPVSETDSHAERPMRDAESFGDRFPDLALPSPEPSPKGCMFP